MFNIACPQCHTQYSAERLGLVKLAQAPRLPGFGVVVSIVCEMCQHHFDVAVNDHHEPAPLSRTKRIWLALRNHPHPMVIRRSFVPGSRPAPQMKLPTLPEPTPVSAPVVARPVAPTRRARVAPVRPTAASLSKAKRGRSARVAAKQG